MTTLVSIAQGGTGANSAPSALASLGAANVAAYAQANTARDTANGAYAQANSAFNQANTVSSSANGAYAQANGAYAQANGAYAQANGAYAQANGAYGQANVAYSQANSAFDQANNAYGQANLAYAAANNSNLKLGGLVSGTLNVTQDLIVGGNIYLEGNTTYINVATYSIEDSLIYLASNNSLTDSVDIGFMGGKNTGGSYAHTGFARDATDGKWKLFDGLADEGHVGNVVDFANTYLATLVANVEANSITVFGNAVATATNTAAAYTQANGAYAQANSAANTVRVSQNGAATLSSKQLNFVNTGNVKIAVTDSGNGNANIEFFAEVGGQLNVSANGGSTKLTEVLNFNNTSSVLVSVSNTGTTTNVSFTTLSGANSVSSVFTANGVSNTYTMSSFAADANNVLVTIDGVVLTPGTDYTVNGTTLTILYVPANNSRIEARSITGGGDGGSASLGFVRNSFVGDGNTVNYTLTDAPVNEDNCLVFVDRILQRNSEYNVASTTLTFNSAPDNSSVIDVFISQYLATDAALLKVGGIVTGDLNVAASLTTQNVLPNANNTYNLGSNILRYKDLYLSNSTIYLGESTISANGGNISFGNATIQLSNVTTKFNVTNDMFVSGSVGIGTASPLKKLDIWHAAGRRHTFHYDDSILSIEGSNDGGNPESLRLIADNLIINTGTTGSGSERLRVTGSGDVGIGTTDPSTLVSKLQVHGRFNVVSNNSYGFAHYSSEGANNQYVISQHISSANGYLITTGKNGSSGSPYLALGTVDTERMRIDANGNVGIGTTNPGSKLHILDSSGPVLRMVRTSNRFDIEADNNALGLVSRDSSTANAYFSGFNGVVIGSTTTVANGTLTIRTATPTITLAPTGYTGQYETTLGTRSGAQAYLIFGNNGDNEIRAGRSVGGGYLDFYANNKSGQEVASDGNFVARMHANGTTSFRTTTVVGDVQPTLMVYSESGRGIITKANTSDYTFLSFSPQNKQYGFYHSTGNTFIIREVGVTDVIQINPNGRINFPAQPAFSMSGTNYTQDSQASGIRTIIKPNQSVFNVGSHYNTSTGVFTAPVAGRYYFAYWGLAYPLPENDRVSIGYRKNGTIQNLVEHNGNSGSHTETSGCIFLDLAANDTVDLTFRRDVGDTAYAYTSQWWMMGYLVT